MISREDAKEVRKDAKKFNVDDLSVFCLKLGVLA
jgi:hypothetical protein